ncbi:MAG TPA: T9SS type A sorting domain-containing protein, partial [bacterium]|nr:T9SS type A sorting domain-containing protein [bacterium]
SSYRKGKSLDISITGTGFVHIPTVTLSGTGITVSSVTFVSSTSIRAGIVISSSASSAARDITVTNASGAQASLASGFTVTDTDISTDSQIDSGTDSEVTLESETGENKVEIPAGALSEDVTVTVSVSSSSLPASTQANIQLTSVGIEVTLSNQSLQPVRDVTITISYRDADIAGMDETRLAIARYNTANSRWVVLPSVVYPALNRIVARTDHFSQFVIVQLAPSADLSSAKVYPNPFNPVRQTAGLTIDSITANAKVKIYTVTGQLVRTLEDLTGAGRVVWDGKNDDGELVASGVYLAYVDGAGGGKVLKIAVVK